MGREASQREWFLYWVLKEVQGLLSEKRKKKKQTLKKEGNEHVRKSRSEPLDYFSESTDK